MKKITGLCFALLLLLSSQLCHAQNTPKATKNPGTTAIEAYYFHNAARCVTCKAVESEAKADLESLYGKQVSFKALNLEEESTKPIAEKLQVSGQTLLVVKGDKKVNLTNEGFMYARTNPAKFKQIIKEKVDNL